MIQEIKRNIKELKEYKNKYFDGWIDFIFRFGIPDMMANLIGLYVWGFILFVFFGFLTLWIFC